MNESMLIYSSDHLIFGLFGVTSSLIDGRRDGGLLKRKYHSTTASRTATKASDDAGKRRDAGSLSLPGLVYL